jgi:hypothetical protein
MRARVSGLDAVVDKSSMKPWQSLSPETQLALRMAYGRYLDQLPPTCSLDTKIERFQRWLAEQGILYTHQS